MTGDILIESTLSSSVCIFVLMHILCRVFTVPKKEQNKVYISYSLFDSTIDVSI